MRLSDFILANIEPILAEWETFARSILAGAGMNSLALRDHADEILLATVSDMKSAQSVAQQSEKSRGNGDGRADGVALNGASDGACFAGHCDWRLPTIAELQSIVDLSAPGCSPVSSTIFALPHKVCAANRVATSRGNPTATPPSLSASIIR